MVPQTDPELCDDVNGVTEILHGVWFMTLLILMDHACQCALTGYFEGGGGEGGLWLAVMILCHHLFQVLFADEGAVVAAGIRRYTRLPLSGRRHKFLQELRVYTPLYIDPAGAQADLPLEGRKYRR